MFIYKRLKNMFIVPKSRLCTTFNIKNFNTLQITEIPRKLQQCTENVEIAFLFYLLKKSPICNKNINTLKHIEKYLHHL